MATVNSLRLKSLCLSSAVFAALMTVGCGSGSNNNGNFPADFNKLSTNQKMAYVMQQAKPDSVARFVCDAALGRVPGVEIDFAQASLYAYENYKETDQIAYSTEHDEYIARQPLPDRMRLTVLTGSEDAQGLGYALGLDYVNAIRDKHMTAGQVETELKEFKKACGSDTATYRRFIIGFHTVLRLDHGKDLPEDIYTRFINYE